MLAFIVLAATLIGAGVDVVAADTTSYASRPPVSTIEPTLTQILATEATQTALSPVSNVQGAAFNRIVQIWLENTVRAENPSLLAR
jgi:acid phosphatase